MGEGTHSLAYLGIDPGASGGIAVVRLSSAGPVVMAWKMPETEADTAELFRMISPSVVSACIEAVHSMPGQGVAWFDMLQLIEDPLKSKN